MKKWITLFFAILFLFAIVCSALADELTCQILQTNDTNATGYEPILRMQNGTGGFTNAHAQQVNGSTEDYLYNFTLYCKLLDYTLNTTSCDEAIPLYLSNTTNAHLSSSSTYSIKSCLGTPNGTISCYRRAICNTEEETIASIPSTTNTHIGNKTDYANRICCSFSEVTQITEQPSTSSGGGAYTPYNLDYLCNKTNSFISNNTKNYTQDDFIKYYLEIGQELKFYIDTSVLKNFITNYESICNVSITQEPPELNKSKGLNISKIIKVESEPCNVSVEGIIFIPLQWNIPFISINLGNLECKFVDALKYFLKLEYTPNVTIKGVRLWWLILSSILLTIIILIVKQNKNLEETFEDVTKMQMWWVILIILLASIIIFLLIPLVIIPFFHINLGNLSSKAINSLEYFFKIEQMPDAVITGLRLWWLVILAMIILLIIFVIIPMIKLKKKHSS